MCLFYMVELMRLEQFKAQGSEKIGRYMSQRQLTGTSPESDSLEVIQEYQRMALGSSPPLPEPATSPSPTPGLQALISCAHILLDPSAATRDCLT